MEEKSNNRNGTTKTRDFFKKLHRSWNISNTLIEKAKEAIKKQFDKKRQNS